MVGFLFHRKSGRLNKFKSGGQYGGDNNIFSEMENYINDTPLLPLQKLQYLDFKLLLPFN